MLRSEFDNKALTSPTWREHKERDHDPWMFVAFVAYLRKKPAVQRTGLEQYVYQVMWKTWIPMYVHKKSLQLVHHDHFGSIALLRRGYYVYYLFLPHGNLLL